MSVQHFGSGAVDNAEAVATVFATSGRCHITALSAGYSADPAAPARITVVLDGAEIAGFPLNTGDPFTISLSFAGWWGPLVPTTSGLQLKLPASGTPGVTGEVNVWVFIEPT